MKSLEDEIEDLEKLDKLRICSAELRDQGREVLRTIKEGWHSAKSSEDAVLVKALSNRVDQDLRDRVGKLEGLTAAEILSADHLRKAAEIPIFRAARAMQALAAAPGAAFSEALLVHYYDIMREIYTADAPDWRSGGARAGSDGRASAYVTGECVRAILGFARTLENTARLIAEVSRARKRREQLKNQMIPDLWRQTELLRLERSFYNSIVREIDNIALKLDLPEDARKLLPLTPTGESVNAFLDEAPERLARAVARTAKTFEAVKDAIEDYRKAEREAAEKEQWDARGEQAVKGLFWQTNLKGKLDRSESGHAVAFGAIRQGLDIARAAASLFPLPEEKQDEVLEELAKRFQKVAEGSRRLIRPARDFLSSILDRELTAVCSEARPGWDPAELAFAAASYGFAAESFEDDRLRKAGTCLARELSARGRYPGGVPFYYQTGGSHAEVIAAEVLRAFAQLLENVEDIPVDDKLVRRMLHLFEDTKRQFPDHPESWGWSLENDHELAEPSRWVTGLSVMALDKINRMLDARINAQVFRHFSVKRERDLSILPLQALFYPDYGLRTEGCRPKPADGWEQEETIALTLERMRGHVLGLSSSREGTTEEPPPFSLILHGPPGTGKTALVEALAKSAGVPLVEVTPSDIVSAGADVVERRARAVFRALSFLTGVVILFDEFDPVLRRRDPGDPSPSTVFTFVTPGMLPKLKQLHDKAKKRRVAYALITNLISRLDPAAIRSGRFDCKAGIYPPDPLSRAGWIMDRFLSSQPWSGKQEELEERLHSLLKSTGGAPIGGLTQRWLERAKVFLADGKESVSPVRKEAMMEPPGKELIGQHEWRQWKWIENWEKQLAGAKSLAAALTPARKLPPVESGEKEVPMLRLVLQEMPRGTAPIPLYVMPSSRNGQKGISPSTPAHFTGETKEVEVPH